MSAVTKTKLTEAEYLAIDEANDYRSEFFQGEMFAMVGGSASHNRIIENLSIRVGGKLWGGPCQSFSSDQRVKVIATGLNTFPDFVIVCDEPEYTSKAEVTLLNPKVIVEVLSSSTELRDRTEKFEHYKRIPSLQEYVLISQDRPLVESFAKQSPEAWLHRAIVGLDQEFEFASVKVSISLAEIYAGVRLPEPTSGLRIAIPPPNPLDAP